MIRILFLLTLIFSSSTFSAEPWSNEATTYLSEHPNTKSEFKEAIIVGKAMLGMCPNEVIAAVGNPGPYKIIKDRFAWGDDAPPPVVASAQCEKPDNSIIEFLFENDRQFGKNQVFRVRFEKGVVVAIDQYNFF